jgi:hypothetical protein
VHGLGRRELTFLQVACDDFDASNAFDFSD